MTNKKDILIDLFSNGNSQLSIDTVLEKTGIKSLGSLKAYCSVLRKENIINLKIKNKKVKRELKKLKVKLKKVKIESKEDKRKLKNYNLILKIIFSIISVICVFISIYYSGFWLCNFLHPIQAYIWAFALVLYAVICPQTAIMLYKNNKKILCCIIAFTGFLVISFSIISTIAGQYKTDIGENYNYNIRKQNIKLIKEEIENTKKSIFNFQKEIEINQKLLKDMLIVDSDYKLISKKLYKLKSRQGSWKRKLDNQNKKLRKIINKKIIVKQNFYSWLKSFLPAWNWKFILYMFPAIFVDIIAPLSIIIIFKKE